MPDSDASSSWNVGDTKDESKAKAGSSSRQHAAGMSGMRIVLNLLLPSVGATLSGPLAYTLCWAAKLARPLAPLAGCESSSTKRSAPAAVRQLRCGRVVKPGAIARG